MSAPAWPGRGTLNMPSHAAAYLESRALPRAAWCAAGLRYLDKNETAGTVAMGPEDDRLVSDSIAVPMSKGGIARLLDKEAEGRRKFSAPFDWPGGICLAALPPKSKLDWGQIKNDARVPLHWAEGPLKAMAFTWHSGLPAIAFNGLDGWSKCGAPLEDLSSIAWKDREVVLLVDSDAVGKVSGQQSLRRQWEYLASVGARASVRVIPGLGDGKTDVNDFIAARGVEALLALEATDMPEDWGARAATQELNQRLAYLTQGHGEVLLIDDDLDYAGTKRVSTVPASKLAPEYQNQQVEVGFKANGEPIYKTKFAIWLEDPYRREASRVWLRPGAPWGIDPKTREFNLWWGWGVTPHPPDARHSWALLQRHIREVIANGDERCAAYAINWMAYCVQHPAKVPEVALVLGGGEGIGKGTLAQALGKVFGRHFLHLATPGQLTGRHNDIMKDKLFVFADENFFAGDHAAASALKAMISEKTMIVEPKFVDAYTLPNYRKFIIASNNTWVVAAGPDARRYAVFQVGEARKKDYAYFAALHDELEHGGHEALLHDLLHRDLSKFDPRRFPQTRALFDQKRLGFDAITEWWFDRLRDTATDWPPYFLRTRVQCEIEERSPSAYDRRGLETRIGVVLRKLCPQIKEGRPRLEACLGAKKIPTRVYLVPPLEDCRAAFENYTRTAINWKTGEPKATDPS